MDVGEAVVAALELEGQPGVIDAEAVQRPKDEFRNSAKAVDLAKKGCELSLWRDGGIVDSLAAAEAEAGQFDDAVRYEQQAISLIKDTNASADTKSMEDRVKLYKQHKPYRDPPE